MSLELIQTGPRTVQASYHASQARRLNRHNWEVYLAVDRTPADMRKELEQRRRELTARFRGAACFVDTCPGLLPSAVIRDSPYQTVFVGDRHGLRSVSDVRQGLREVVGLPSLRRLQSCLTLDVGRTRAPVFHQFGALQDWHELILDVLEDLNAFLRRVPDVKLEWWDY